MEEEQQPNSRFDNLGLYGYFDTIRRVMPMYIGSFSVRNLFFVLLGWREAQRQTERPLTAEESEFFSGFQEHVFRKYRKSGSASWDRHIIERCGGDGEEAVAEFYRLFDEFREEKRKEKEREARKRRKQAQSAVKV